MSHSQLSNVHRLFISYGVSSSSVTYRSPAFKNKKTPVMGNTFVMYNYFKINALMTVLLALLSQSQTIKNHELFFSETLKLRVLNKLVVLLFENMLSRCMVCYVLES